MEKFYFTFFFYFYTQKPSIDYSIPSGVKLAKFSCIWQISILSKMKPRMKKLYYFFIFFFFFYIEFPSTHARSTVLCVVNEISQKEIYKTRWKILVW